MALGYIAGEGGQVAKIIVGLFLVMVSAQGTELVFSIFLAVPVPLAAAPLMVFYLSIFQICQQGVGV